jgi:hypothetical protein
MNAHPDIIKEYDLFWQQAIPFAREQIKARFWFPAIV